MRYDAALQLLLGELAGNLSHLAERVRTTVIRATGIERWPVCLRLLVLPIVAATYVSFIGASANINAQALYIWIALYVVLAAVTLVALIHSTAHRLAYRIAGLCLDILAITALVIGAHEHGVFFVQFYVITCVGYGLRYGKPLLLCATWGSTVAFMVVLNFSTYWQEHVQLGAGLFLSVLLLPLLAYRINTRARKLRSVSEQQKHDYFVTTSHEIRTSVNAIIGLADLLKESTLSTEQSDWVHALTDTGEVLLSLVGNVLEKAQTEAGKMPIRHNPFVLSSVVKYVYILLRTSADQKGIGLSYDIAVEPHIHTLIGDRCLISQVLINLVENAIKFTDKGSVLLRVTQEASCAPHQVTLLWEVIDTGPGIPAEAVHEIFEPFSRVNGNHKAHKNGTGLGAMIAKDLAQQMGGELGVTTELYKGSTFWFKLNLGLPTHPQTSSDSTPSSSEEANLQRHSLSVLLVEDNRTNRTVTTRTLEKLGHVVTSADSGTAALAHIAATQFDLVLLDMEMPGIGGLEVLVRTKQLPDKEWMPPTFVLTAHASYEAKVACKTAGAAGFLTKPITANRLQQELANVCRRTHEGEDSTSERAVDASRLSDQLALSHGDFSYVN